MAKRKSSKRNPEKKSLATGYKIEARIAKPVASLMAGKTPERLTLEQLKVGQSFALLDRAMRKRVRDICYRLKLSAGRVYSMISTDKEVRVWRDK